MESGKKHGYVRLYVKLWTTDIHWTKFWKHKNMLQ